MFEPRISPDQLEIREAIREFVRHEVAPAVSKSEHLEDLSCPLLLPLVDMASRLGLRTLALPEELGGSSAGVLTCCIAMEELGAGDAGIAATLARTALLAKALVECGPSDAQRDRWLQPFQEDERFHIAYAGHCGDADQDLAYHGNPEPAAAGGLTATRQSKGDWIVNGATATADNVPVAKLFVVEIPGAAAGAPHAFLVTPDTPGVSVEAHQVLFGESSDGRLRRWSHGVSGQLKFSDCRIPAASVIEASAKPLRDAGRSLWASPVFAAINLGVGRCALEAAIDYTKIRVQGGRRIVEHQAIGAILSDCAIKLEAARNLVWKAAWALDHPEDAPATGYSAAALARMAKVFTSEAVHDVTLRAAECFGAMGVMLDMPLAKYVRDARIFLHSGRSNPVGRFRIAEELAGFSAAG